MNRALVRMIVCMSLDGRVADGGGSANQLACGGWTSPEDKARFREDVGKADMLLIGRKTAQSMPNLKIPVVVVSRSLDIIPQASGLVDVLRPDKDVIIKFLERHDGATVLLCGGVMTYDLMLRAGLVDEIVMTIEPVVLLSGPTLAACNGAVRGVPLHEFKLIGYGLLNQNGTLRAEYRRF